MRALISAFILLLASLSVVAAQEMTTQPGLPNTGAASLRVQVFGTNHAFLSTQALVRLHDPRQMHEAWDTTHDRSETVFYHLSPGTYEVEVSGAGYHTSVAQVEVFDQPIQYTVQVILKADPGTEVYKPDNDAGLSEKARKESQKGVIALQKGKLKDAEKHLRKALKEEPKSAQINYLLGVVLLRGKRTHEADQLFVEAVALDPLHARALTTLGGLRLEQKDLPSAVKFLEQAIASDRKQWRPHWLLANARLQQERFQDAKAEAELAIKLSNDSAPAVQLVLGEALGNLGDYKEAIIALRSFLQQVPSSTDASAVQQMISEMENAQRTGRNAVTSPAAFQPAALPLQAPIVPLMAPEWKPPAIDSIRPTVAAGVSCPIAQVLSGAGGRVQDLLNALDRFSATEVQTHEELDRYGDPLTREVRKSEYVVTVSQAQSTRLDLQEFRRDLSGLGAFSDRIATRGLLTLALVFDPHKQSDYQFDCEGLGEWKGQPTWLVHYRQLPGHTGGLQSFDVGQSSYPVLLRGRAWIRAVDSQILHIEAELSAPMPEIELQSEHEIANYGPVAFAAKKLQLWLPEDTQMYLDLRGHRYRFSNHYTDFKIFSVDSNEKVTLPRAQ